MIFPLDSIPDKLKAALQVDKGSFDWSRLPESQLRLLHDIACLNQERVECADRLKQLEDAVHAKTDEFLRELEL